MLSKVLLLVCVLCLLCPGAALAQADAPPEAYEIPQYQVQPGDTLFSIARRYGTTVDALARVNGLADPRQIYVGQQLRLVPRPAAVDMRGWQEHDVALGEDFSLLAHTTGLDWRDLALANRLLNPGELSPGQTVSLPPRDALTPALVPTGETLLTAALRQGVSFWSLAALNPRPLYTGGELLLPGAGASPYLPYPIASVALSSPSVERGQTVVLLVETVTPAACDVAYLERSVPCYIQDPTHLYALVGIDPMLDPGDFEMTVRLQVDSGEVALQLPVRITPGRFNYERIDLPPDRQNLLDPALLQTELNKLALLRDVYTPTRSWQFPFRFPVQAAVSSYFGSRRSYGGAFNSYHAGVDFRAGTGTPVRVPASGVVVLAEPLAVRGNAVMVDHGWGLLTGYWHLSRIDVTVGQRVTQGDVLGLVGNTGLSTGSHLHWEMWIDGQAVNPLQWVEPFYAFPDPVLPVVSGAQ